MTGEHQDSPPNPTDSQRHALRRRAEDAYLGSAADLSDRLGSMPIEALHHALHELGVHQIELEMQNEELRQTQNERDTSQARYFDFYDMAPVGYCTVSGAGLIEQANLTAASLLGRARKLLLQQQIANFIRPDDQDSFYAMRQRIIETREPQSCELRFLKPNSVQFWAHLDALGVPDKGATPALRIVMTDITARKLAEVALRDSNAYLENLINFSHTPIIVWDSKLCITRFNHAIELLSGHSEADVIGQSMEFLFPIEQAKKSMAQIRQTLTGERLDKVEIDIQHKNRSIRNVEWNSAPLFGPAGRAIDSVVVQGFDITERKLAEEKIKRSIADLKSALLGTVNVVTTMGALRDPYTAAHSQRVGDIASAVGAELGFDAHEQEGLRIASYMHDIGKISVPAEILVKPGAISPIEHLLIQGHAQVGYDMLKDLKFPWEIALVALQHHERMDGSGYPNGLKGEAISLKARVVAVADVVEAMSSHRPYRPARGVGVALEEIERGRGTIYDANVVDACLRLFRDKGFVIPV